ncbi:MAG TPA: DUF1552 domain-containing protein [Gammaproteobacteria bacterium]|nr:DUF1552 domain-containing protein [Gammaproteobacteria bacterium]
MFLTKKHLSRRTVLKGAGVSLALPLLDAMIPAATALAQTAAAAKLRVGFFYFPHGAIQWNTSHGAAMDRWNPSGSGANFKLSEILSPLEEYKHLVTSFSNLENKANQNSVHAIVPATWLSGTRPDSGTQGASMSTTIDQMIAARIGQETSLPSLEVASEITAQQAACPSGAGCYYSTTLSFRDATSPLPMEFNPRKVFTQLFGEGDTDAERAAVNAQTRSLLDLITDRAAALQKQVGASDRVLLDQYMTTVREIERRVQMAEQRDLSAITLPEAPIGELESFDDQVKLMFDLIALAYQANLTRVASYIMVAEGTQRTYNHIGVPDAFHPLSHHANKMDSLVKLVRIQKYHVERFAGFVKKLAQTPDGDGSLLDHSLFMYGSNMSNSDKHNNYPLPNILVGGANGQLKGGQQVELPEHTPLTNLLLTVLNKAGLEMKSFVDSTGEIAGV